MTDETQILFISLSIKKIVAMDWRNLFGFSRPKTKPFYAWQIELTTRCPLKCKMCIREGIKDWHNGDMNISDFKRLTPYLKDVETVVLEGWGESLLHKNLIEIIRVAKAAGPRVGFVTSGKVLNREYISELINAGVDFIGFSLSGATLRTHNAIRVNSNLQSLIEHIQTFNEIKRNKKIKNPKLHIVYLMLKDNISEVPALLKLVKEIGIEEVVLTNLIHVANEWQEGQRVFRCAHENYHPPLNPLPSREGKIEESHPLIKGEVPSPLVGEGKGEGVYYKDLINEAEIKAKELNISLRRPSLSPIEVTVCEENPLRNLYISVDGEVSPCVYLYPPTSSLFKRIFCGNEYQLEKVSFGNIFKEPFHTIWNSRGYVEFRNYFIKRKGKVEEMYSYLWNMKRLNRFEMEPLPDPPEQCRICHKMLGV